MPIIGFGSFGGGGASYINGVVDSSADLPVTLGTPALDSVYLAKAGSGVWLINRKPAGLYVRVANNGVAADWTYLGAFPEVNSSANWELYDGTDPTKELKFNLANISTGTTRTLTVPDSSGVVAILPTISILSLGNTTHNATAARYQLIRLTLTDAQGASIVLPSSGNVEGDRFVVVLESVAGSSPIVRTSNYSFITSINGVGRKLVLIYNNGNWFTEGVDAHIHPASDISGTFTSFSANNPSLTASTPFTFSQGWIAGSTTFTALQVNVTDTASSASSLLQDWRVGGTSVASINKSGTISPSTATAAPPTTTTAARGIQWNNVGSSTSQVGIYGSYAGTPTFGIGIGASAGSLTEVAAFTSTGLSVTGGLTATTSLTLGTSGILSGGTNLIEQVNSTNAQTFRIYNTFTSATNHERGFFKWSSNVLQIGTEKGTVGGTARALEFQTDGVTRLTLGAGSGNASSLTSAATIYANGNDGYGYSLRTGGSIIAGGIQVYAIGHPINGSVGLNFTWTGSAGIIATGNSVTAVNFNTVGSGNNTLEVNNSGVNGNGRVVIRAGGIHDQALLIDPRGNGGITLNGLGTTNNLVFQTTNATRLTIGASGGITIADANDIAVGTTTGTKIGTSTSQKIGFFNATPLVQPSSTGLGTSGFTAGGGGNTVHATSTFTGNVGSTAYTISDIVAHLKNLGLIAV